MHGQWILLLGVSGCLDMELIKIFSKLLEPSSKASLDNNL